MEPWAVHTVHERARVHGDEDGVGQVGEDDGESSRRPVRRARANDSKASRLGGRSDTRRHRRFDRFGLKTGETVTSCGGVREDLTGLTSKSGETGLTGLGLKGRTWRGQDLGGWHMVSSQILHQGEAKS